MKSKIINRYCPICQKAVNHSFIMDGIYLCKKCKTAYNDNHKIIPYSDRYFLEDYKNQYGKTYAEDHDNIYLSAQNRLCFIVKLLLNKDNKDRSLLDIGSALGFFLEAARDNGFTRLQGIEISEFASSYCRDNLNIPVEQISFDDLKISDDFYSVITAWYFLEHNRNSLETIRKIYGMLDIGGVFAFSVPSTNGPLFMFKNDLWCKTHPIDHSIDFSSYSIKKFLYSIGFSKVLIVPAGFHPERIISNRSLFFRPFSFMYKYLVKILKFSDTIEVYAKK